MSRILEFSLDRLDLIGGIGGCLIGAVIIFLAYLAGMTAPMEIGAAILIASVIYLLFRKRIVNSAADISLPPNRSLTLILNIIFFFTFAASIFLMHSSLYRPPLYFLLTSISVAAVTAGILFSDSKTQTWLLLLEILLISFSLRAGLLYEYPGFYGVDPWGHGAIIETWLNEGHITPYVLGIRYGYTGYVDFPVMHLNVMAVQLVTSLGPKDSLFLSIGLFYIMSTLFVFLLGQHLLGTKFGLLAALAISINQFHIVWGAWLIPTSLGIGIFAMMLYLIFSGTSNVKNSLILVIMSFALIFTHTLSSFVMLVALVLLLIAKVAYASLVKANIKGINIGVNLVMLFGVAMLAWWMYSFYYPGQSFFEAVIGAFVRAIQVETEYVGVAFSPSEFILNRVGFLMLIGFIVLGSLFWLSRKMLNNSRLCVLLGIAGLSIVTYAFPLFNIRTLIPGRWPVFIVVLGAAVTVQGISALSSLAKSKIKKALLLVLIIFAFSMFTLNTTMVNTHSPLCGELYPEDPPRNAFTQSELTAADTILEVYDGVLATDYFYAYLPFMIQIGLERLGMLRPDSKCEKLGLIVLRRYLYTHLKEVELFRVEFYKEWSPDFFTQFDTPKYNLIYSNGEVKAYLVGE